MKLFELIENYQEDSVDISGHPRATTNSNGDRIATTRQGLLNFYRWFGNSVVLDKWGRPLVVYHGTKHRQQPKIFEPSYKQKTKQSRQDTSAAPAPLAKRHPPTMTGYNKVQAGMYFTPTRTVAAAYGAPEAYYLRIESPMRPKGDNYLTLFTNGDVEILKNELGKDGYIDRFGSGEYVVFDSNQIKRVDNIGTFSAKSKIVTK